MRIASMKPTEQDKMSNQSEQGEIILETKQLAEVSLYMFEQYRKEFFTPGKHHFAVPQFHHWLQQLIKESEDKVDDQL